MRYKKVLMLLFIVLVFSGCISNLKSGFQKVQVVYVNVSVISQDNKTVIQDIKARGGEVSKLQSPGAVLPQGYPAIYVEILQEYNISRPGTLKVISAINGQDFKGPGNYSFTVQILENTLNKNQSIYVLSDITTNQTRIARARIRTNWTE